MQSSDREVKHTAKPKPAKHFFPGKAAALTFALGVIAALPAQAAPEDNPASDFRVFDTTFYSRKPDLTAYGVQPLRIVYENQLFAGGRAVGAPPDPDRIKTALQGKPDRAGLVVIDIETWTPSMSPSVVRSSIGKYLATLNRFRAQSPGTRFGFFGIVPSFTIERALAAPGSPQYRQWQAQNDTLRPIADNADVLFPQVYTYTWDRNAWRKYATANLSEARRIAHGKPVYCFLWPQYAVQGSGYPYLPPDYWRLELDTCRKNADGIVIWGGSATTADHSFRPAAWSDAAPWWRQTLDFLAANGVKGR